MSRPTRNETLQALGVIRGQDGSPDRPWNTSDLLVVIEAAEGYARLAPDTCPQCQGDGRATYNPSPDAHCTVCGGRGYVWPDNLIERATVPVAIAIAETGNVGWGDLRIGQQIAMKVAAERAIESLLNVLWEVDGNEVV